MATNLATIDFLKDTADGLTVKLTLTANGSAQEAVVRKVNPDTLAYRVWSLPLVGAYGVPSPALQKGENLFVAGEAVSSPETGATGRVIGWDANAVYVTNVVGNFSNASVNTATTTLLGGLLHHTLTLNATANATSVAALLDIESVWYSVSTPGVVELRWLGTSTDALTNVSSPNTFNASVICMSLVGDGYFGRNALGGIIKPPTARVDETNANGIFTANGSIAVTTANLVALGSYTIILELRKRQGFFPVPDERSST